jgi:hypothetical protein
MKITKTQLREIIKEEIQSIKEATETAEWTKDEIALIKRTKVKVDGKMHKFTIEKNKVAKFNVKHKDNPSWGTIEKYLIRGKTSYDGWFEGYAGAGAGWKGSEIKATKEFDEEQNLKLLTMMFKKLQTKVTKVWS